MEIMSLQSGLVTYIEAQVSSAGKGYPLLVPQDAAKPSWAYQVIDDEQVLAHSGGTGFYKARVQIDILGEETPSLTDYNAAVTIAAAMRAALDGYKGAMGSVTVKYCQTSLNDDYAQNREAPSIRFDVLINYR